MNVFKRRSSFQIRIPVIDNLHFVDVVQMHSWQFMQSGRWMIWELEVCVLGIVHGVK